MKARGVDSIYSWVVALSCGIIYMMISWPMKLGSLLFVEMIDRYDTNRKDASLPFALAYLMRSLSSPFGGYFGEKFGLQQVTMFGCILCSIGVGLCFFSEEIISIDIFLGLIYGFGLGWSSCLVPEIMNQHFVKHRTKGFSVVLGVSGAIHFITPLLLEKIISDCGVSGSFLIMSAIILNSVPAAMLIINPEEKNTRRLEQSSLQTGKNNLLAVEPIHCTPNSNLDFVRVSRTHTCLELSPGARPNSSFVADQSTSNAEEPCSSVNQPMPMNTTKHSEQRIVEINNDIATHLKLQDKSGTFPKDKKLEEENDLQHIIKSRGGKLAEINDLPHIIESRDRKLEEVNDLPHIIESRDRKLEEVNDLPHIIESGDRKLEEENDLQHIIESRDRKLEEELNSDLFENIDNRLTNETNKFERKKKKASPTKYETIDILWNPVFLLIAFIQSSFFYIQYISWTVLVDLVRDKNIPRHLEVYFVVGQGVVETIGRMALGFVTDSGYMEVRNYCALCFGLIGLSCTLLVWVSGFPMTMTAICIFGFISGTNLTALPGIVTEFIEKEKRTLAMASRLILYVPMSFTMSPLIGYFRGTLGSYNGLLYVMTALCASCSIVLVFLPRVKKYIEKEDKSSKL
ncbi:uncharacterized protein [Parasteatoda tepidariorum]|nr:uncharacterized protein LOC107437539 [Parasteatoda tepidariorum]